MVGIVFFLRIQQQGETQKLLCTSLVYINVIETQKDQFCKSDDISIL